MSRTFKWCKIFFRIYLLHAILLSFSVRKQIKNSQHFKEYALLRFQCQELYLNFTNLSTEILFEFNACSSRKSLKATRVWELCSFSIRSSSIFFPRTKKNEYAFLRTHPWLPRSHQSFFRINATLHIRSDVFPVSAYVHRPCSIV